MEAYNVNTNAAEARQVRIKLFMTKSDNLLAQQQLAAEAKKDRKGFSSADQCVTIESHLQTLFPGAGIPAFMPLKRLRVGHQEDRLCV